MTRQKSEDREVSKGRRKTVPTSAIERREGEKAIPVNKQTGQLVLRFGTAEETTLNRVAAEVGAVSPGRKTAPHAVPKPNRKDKQITSATMEEVCDHLLDAFQKVASNKGAPGPDRQTINEVREHLDEMLPELRKSLIDGSYEPGNIRRVWIPKSGGHRGLGIPNVVDRLVAEAVRQVLEPLYEPTFHAESHGFRPGRSCHTAIAEARRHVEDGYDVVVDLDLANFFDRVSHQRLTSRLSQRVKDRRLLVLIGRMLKAKVVMPDGVVVNTEEGVPQGGPLSPLLSNIVLDELDAELSRRGHRFVRYADDSNVYVRSERAGQRVMASIVCFIEKRLRLKVNVAKSAVAHTGERHFLGFSLRRDPSEGKVEVVLSKRSQDRIRSKIRELTPRNWGNSLDACIRRLNAYLEGWINFFGVCTPGVERTLMALDAHIRRRLRAIQLKHWKKKRTIAKKLISLGIRVATAWRSIYSGRKSLWALSHSPAVDRALRNAYFAERRLVSLLERWQTKNETIIAPALEPQLTLRLGQG